MLNLTIGCNSKNFRNEANIPFCYIVCHQPQLLCFTAGCYGENFTFCDEN